MIDVLAGLYAHLVTEGEFEDQLDAIETARSVTIVRPREIVTRESVSRQYPCIEILPAEGTPEYGSDSRAAEGFDYHDVDVIAYHSSNDVATVQATLLYYDLALAMVIRADYSLGGRFNRVRRGEVIYGDMFQRKNEETFLQILRRRLEVRQPFEEMGE
ncbi:MAG: hypothetical protein IT186_14050 [Acidobacteria bacterium]|nr:hypothetical protein [Acidobacteriota bacterium]